MQKIWRLTSVVLKRFSLLQFDTIFGHPTPSFPKKCSKNNSYSGTEISKTRSTMTDFGTKTNSKSSLADVIQFLEVVGKLKHLKRTGWVMRNVPDCETVAGHMYRMSIMTFLLDEKSGLDRIKCMELALIHDLAESIVGDITPYCGVSKEEKKQRELDAMQEIAKLIEPQGQKLLDLFNEYEESITPESQFVKDLDRLDMVVQAFEYEKRDKCPQRHQEFFDSTNGKFNNSLVRDLVDEIKAQRERLLKESSSSMVNGESSNNDSKSESQASSS